MLRRKYLYTFGVCMVLGTAGCLSDGSDHPQPSSRDETNNETQIRGNVRVDRSDSDCANMIEIGEYDHSLQDNVFIVDGRIRNVADESQFLSDDPVTVSLTTNLGNSVSDPTEVYIEPDEEAEFTVENGPLAPSGASPELPEEYELQVEPHCEDVDPVILNVEGEGDLLTIPTGTAEITVEVENQGGTGQVTVTAFIFDEQENRIDRHTATRTMGSDDIETFRIRPSIDDGAEYYEVYATPVCDRPNDENNPYFC